VVERRRLYRRQGLEPWLDVAVGVSAAIIMHLTHKLSSTVHFSGSYSPGSSGGSLALYGWSTNPLVEYYVMEDFPSPPTYGLTHVGTLSSDGATYDFYKHQQVNQPSIVSQSSTFEQYISIRQSKRSSGAITFANHVNAWKKAGLNLGTMNYQIMSTESYGGGSGSASITVS
jgi:endo-1,4-beta-xylanase